VEVGSKDMAVGRIRRFLNIPILLKIAILEAAFSLVIAQLLINCVPYRWWSRTLGPIGPAHDNSPLSAEDDAVQIVARVIDTAGRHLPWEIVCLPRAVVAKWMLARRNIASTMFLGIQRPVSDGAKGNDLHAWLRVGDQTIMGGDVADQFTIIARYGK
jgi:hypothetical protein